MKRTFLILALIAAVTYIQAQCKTKVVSAYSCTNNGQLDKAKKFIDEAISDACTDTKNWAKTWYYRGNLYLKIHQSDDVKYKNLDSNALNIAYDSYQKAIELDTKKEFENEIMFNLVVCGQEFYDKAVEFYNEKKYVDAMNSFDKTASIYTTFSMSDSLPTFNAAVCADYAGLQDKAIEYYKRLIKINYLKAEVYSNLINIYRDKYLNDNPYKKIDIGTDTVKVIELLGKPSKISKETINKTKYDKWLYEKNKFYMLMEYGKVSYYNTDSIITDLSSFNEGKKIVDKGELLFPDNTSIIIAEANLYLTANKFNEAKTALDKLREKDPTNPTVYYAIGNAYYDQYNNESNTIETREKAFTDSESAYKKSIELKSDYFDAIYMLGAIYFNEGIRLEKESENYFSDMTKFKQYKEKVDNLYKLATEKLERASELSPEDYNTLISLKKLYAKLSMNDKLKAVDEKLKLLH